MTGKPDLKAARAAERTWAARAEHSAAEAWVHQEVANIWEKARHAVSDAHGVEKMLAKNTPLEDQLVRARIMLSHTGEWVKATEMHYNQITTPTPPFTLKPGEVEEVLASEHGDLLKRTTEAALAMAREAAAWGTYLVERAEQEVTA